MEFDRELREIFKGLIDEFGEETRLLDISKEFKRRVELSKRTFCYDCDGYGVIEDSFGNHSCTTCNGTGIIKK